MLNNDDSTGICRQQIDKYSLRHALSLGIATLLAAGCGGSDDTSAGPADETGSPSTSTGVGTFLDSRVSGLSYTTDSGTGETDNNGQFTYTEGDSVTFSIGNITLPTIPAKSTITPLDVFSASEVSEKRVVNLARYLQTIDSDGDPSNGIDITQGAREAAAGAIIDFNSDSFDSEIQPVIDASGMGDRALVSESNAVAHLQETLDALPPEGIYFEVYGMQAGDYDNTTKGRDLIGTSQGGLRFDVSDYDRFLIFVPAGADRLFLDAVGYQDGSQDWLDSIEGDEYMHRSDAFDPFSSNPDCSWNGGCTKEDAGGNVYSAFGEDYVEGPPDDYALTSTPGEDSYYQYSTFSADSMRVYLTSSPIQ